MEHTTASAAAAARRARAPIFRIVSPAFWLVAGFASACLASPVLPWPKSLSFTATAQAAPHSKPPEAQPTAPRPADSTPYEPGGPGPDDKTEWMPGNR